MTSFVPLAGLSVFSGARVVSISRSTCSPTPIRPLSRCEAERVPEPERKLKTGRRMFSFAAFAAIPGISGLARGKRPEDLGVYGNKLQTCPAGSENCISTYARDPANFVYPWTYNTPGTSAKSVSQAVSDLKSVFGKSGEKVTVVAEDRRKDGSVYLYAEFETPLVGYTDDVEFFFETDGRTVGYRSASRLGKSDLGANRKRIKNLRLALQEKGWTSKAKEDIGL
eukprot:tig00000983_g5904.t1